MKPHGTKGKSWKYIVGKILIRTGQTNNNAFRAWLMSKEYLGLQFDANMYLYCYKVYKKILNKDDDHLTIIEGLEGVGKSTFAAKIAAVISPSFNLFNITNTYKHVVNNWKKNRPNDSMVYDEASSLFFNRNSYVRDNKDLIEAFMQIRGKRINHILCVTNYYYIDEYIRKHRVDYIISMADRYHYKFIHKDAVPTLNEQKHAYKKSVQKVKLATHLFNYGYIKNGFPTINDVNEKTYKALKNKNINQAIDKLYIDPEAEEELETLEKSISLVQFAKNLGITYKHARSLVDTDKLRVNRIGRAIKVPISEYKRQIEAISLGKQPSEAQKGGLE